MRNLVSGLWLLAMIVICATLSSCDNGNSQQDDYEDGLYELPSLKLNLPKGYTIQMRRTDRVHMEEKEKGIRGIRHKYTTELDFTLTCLEVTPEGDMIIEQTWDGARAKGVGIGGTFDWNSDKPARVPVQARRYQRLVGKTIKVQVSPDGTIQELWNGEVIAEAILWENGIKPGAKMEQEEFEVLRDQLLDGVWESKEHILDNILRSYPRGKLSGGQTWTIYETGFSTRQGAQETLVTFNGVRGADACCDLTVSASAGADALEDNPIADVESEIDATGTGEMKVDIETGLITWAEVSLDARLHQEIEDRLWEIKKDRNFTGTIVTTFEVIE